MDPKPTSTLRQALRAALIAFLLSRAIVLLAILVPALLLPAAFDGPASDRVVMRISVDEISSQLGRLAVANDAGWYHAIAADGYEQRPFDDASQANWAFFPMLPLLWALAMRLFGDATWVALLIPNAALFAALAALYLLARHSGRDQAGAERAVLAIALLPSSYFFSFPWTESLFLLSTVACMLFASRRQWAWMALAGIVASGTRFPGLFLVPAIALQLLATRQTSWRAWFAVACMPLGAIAFALHLAWITGNPLAFSDIQSAWGRHFEAPIRAIGIVFLRPDELAIDWNLRYLNLAALGLAILAFRHLLYRRETAFAVFLALCVLAPLLTGTLTSMSRYVTALFPIALAIGDWTCRPMLERVWMTASGALLALMALAFSVGLTIAGA